MCEQSLLGHSAHGQAMQGEGEPQGTHPSRELEAVGGPHQL